MACQHAKVHRHNKAPLEPLHIPEGGFDYVNVVTAYPLLWIYSPTDHYGQDHKVAGGCVPVIHHIGRNTSGICLGLGGPVWYTFLPNL